MICHSIPSFVAPPDPPHSSARIRWVARTVTPSPVRGAVLRYACLPLNGRKFQVKCGQHEECYYRETSTALGNNVVSGDYWWEYQADLHEDIDFQTNHLRSWHACLQAPSSVDAVVEWICCWPSNYWQLTAVLEEVVI